MGHRLDRLMYRLTLRWVNHWRRKLGDPELDQLLVGRPADAQGCPVTNSIGHGASCTQTMWGLHDAVPPRLNRIVPFWVSSFIKRFDHGHYPELALNLKQLQEMRDPLGEEDPGGVVRGLADQIEDVLDAILIYGEDSPEVEAARARIGAGEPPRDAGWVKVAENEGSEAWEQTGTPA